MTIAATMLSATRDAVRVAARTMYTAPHFVHVTVALGAVPCLSHEVWDPPAIAAIEWTTLSLQGITLTIATGALLLYKLPPVHLAWHIPTLATLA